MQGGSVVAEVTANGSRTAELRVRHPAGTVQSSSASRSGQPPNQWVSVALSKRVKRPGMLIRVPLSIAEAKRVCSYASNTPYSFMALRFITHRGRVCHQLHLTNSDVKKSQRKHRRRPSHQSVSVSVCLDIYCSVSHVMFWQDVLSVNLTVKAIMYCGRPFSCPDLNTSQMHLKSQLFKAQNIPILCQTEPEALKHALNYESLTPLEYRHMFMFLSTV